MRSKLSIVLVMSAVLVFADLAAAQSGPVFTGGVLAYGSGRNTRTYTSQFTLRLNGLTSDSDTSSLLSVLDDKGQDGLLDALKGRNLGSFALTGQLGRDVLAARVSTDGDRTVVRVLFERWINANEIRYGLRSADYPFGYAEIRIDPATGKGEGTLILAARVRFKNAKNGPGGTVEIEDFGTFPSKLMGVQMKGRMIQ